MSLKTWFFTEDRHSDLPEPASRASIRVDLPDALGGPRNAGGLYNEYLGLWRADDEPGL